MKIKKIIYCLVWGLTGVLYSSCSGPDYYVSKAIDLMDDHALYAEGPDWEAAKKEALDTEPQTYEEAQEIVKKALKVAGGKHSFIYKSEDVKTDFTSEWKMPEVNINEQNVAIIKLPPFSGNDKQGQKYAHTVIDAIPENIAGAIIDLRGNTGGNMYPMIAAVHQFIDDSEHILRFKSRKRSDKINLDYVLRVVGIERQKQLSCSVALITDSLTASSGEATLICFRGLDKVRSFGSPTAGYASANAPYDMPDGSKLVITTSCDVARTGEVFCDEPIAPDSLTKEPMEAAVKWISEYLKNE
ncbi:MAG: S41 family peptidase [Bacteroidales bacterium]|nr:S41 family peptidase [Bacteroidales bacterium]